MPLPKDRYDASNSNIRMDRILFVSVFCLILGIVLGIAFNHLVFEPFFNNSSTKGISSNKTVLNIPPIITKISISNISENGAQIKWTTDRPSTSRVTFCVPNSGCCSTGTDQSFKTNHDVTIKDLTPNTTYEVTLTSIDADQNQIDLTLDNCLTTLFYKDNQIPIISNVSDNDSNKTIKWTTSENATCLLIFWSDSFDKVILPTHTKLTDHSLDMSSIPISTKKTYYYMIAATDTSGNLNISDIRIYKSK